MENVTCQLFQHHEHVVCNGSSFYPEEGLADPGSATFFVDLGVSLVLVLLAGVFSGLTLGLLSFDTNRLEILIQAGTKKQAKQAENVLPLVKKHHLLLVTLLLSNAAVNETLPLFLDNLVPTYVAIIVSVTAVLLFGEVIPQALCSKHGLAIGSFFSPFVHFLIFILLPIGWPLAKLLDCVLGTEHTAFFRRAELGALVSMHGTSSQGNEEPLTKEEVKIIQGALDMSSKTVRDAMQRLTDIYTLSMDTVLDKDKIKEIKRKGYSRIPVCVEPEGEPTRLLLAKSLIGYDPDDRLTVSSIHTRALMKVAANQPLYEVLDMFRTGKGHLAAVFDPSTHRVIGVITMEDVIEELLNDEIVDETDQYVDIRRKILVSRARRLSAALSFSNPQGVSLVVRSRPRQSEARQGHAQADETAPLIGSVNTGSYDDDNVFTA